MPEKPNPKNSSILDALASQSHEHEFYTPIPKGYTTGKTKYVIVFGTVMSGLGKGIFSSSLAKLLQNKGLQVQPIKFDGYLNIDAGTLNPFRHGEVFVLDDGLECDMDLGTYERYLNLNLSAQNYMTGGKIFNAVLTRERKGSYLGRDVQIIPHVTGEIKLFMRSLAMNTGADIIFMEVGGTVGDFENAYFIEAMRELAYEEGKENVCFVALTYILEPQFLGEQKSKAAQLGLRSLLSLGIQPDIVACRSFHPISEKVREKISIYSNVPLKNVVGVHDCDSIYTIPNLLKEENIDQVVLARLGLSQKAERKKEVEAEEKWNHYIDNFEHATKTVTIGITGKYTTIRDSYASILHALEHATTNHKVKMKVKWIETTDIEQGVISVEEALKDVSGIIVPGGFGKRGVEGKIECIKYAREKKLPYLGLCFGFQMAIIEFARHVCGLKDAHTTEVKPDTKHPVICILPEQKDIESLGGNMRLGGHDISLLKNTQVYEIYGKKDVVRERFRHRFECNPEYISQLEKQGMVFSGKAKKNPSIMQFLELKNHPFFIGTQAHPEFTSHPLQPNPLYFSFVKACLQK